MSSKTTNGGGIEDVEPDNLLEMYLRDKSTEYSTSTLRSHESRLGFLVEWFREETSYDYVSEMGRADVFKYKQWRFNRPHDDDVDEDEAHSVVTIKTQMDTVRGFLHWAQSRGFAQPDIAVAAESPDIDNDENVAHRFVDVEQVETALDYLREYEWGQRQTVILQLVWQTAMRRGAIRALDVDDWHPDEQYIEVRHRPETGTPLKNQGAGERDVAVSDETADLIDAWIDGPRPARTGEHGREPLITTTHGRVSVGCVQTDVYDALRPRRVGDDCGCENGCRASGKNDAYKCVDSEGPHAVRSTAITHHLNQGWPIDYLSDRVNCAPKTLKKHYDEATETEKMERRRDFVDNL